MRAKGYGRVLSIAPAAGAFGSAADPAGAALAGALHALMKSLAAGHLGGDLRVNTLSPLVGSAMTAAFLDAIPTLDRSCFDTEAPLALAIHLCHEACAVTGESFSAGAGRFARIFPATAPGFFQPGLADEQVGANLAAIMDPEGYIVPRDAQDELVLVAV
jgi:NAD(P)-dependent dehydrogenase (short-subunit alcohol dehydrogenase family)